MTQSDTNVTLAELKARIKAFADARNWLQFHNGKNLAMSVAIEAAELMEHFQWSPPADEAIDKAEVAEELADVLIYAFAFANRLEIDIATAITAKLDKNEHRFPIEADGKAADFTRKKTKTEQR